MTVTCEKCGKVYDDARRWTLCPHRSLDESAGVSPYIYQTEEEKTAARSAATPFDAIEGNSLLPVDDQCNNPLDAEIINSLSGEKAVRVWTWIKVAKRRGFQWGFALGMLTGVVLVFVLLWLNASRIGLK